MKSAMWDLSMILTDENGAPRKTPGGKVHYRCLACGDWERGTHKGIRQLQYHLEWSGAGKVERCQMTTPRLFELMGLESTIPDLLLPNIESEDSSPGSASGEGAADGKAILGEIPTNAEKSQPHGNLDPADVLVSIAKTSAHVNSLNQKIKAKPDLSHLLTEIEDELASLENKCTEALK